nr:GNAT family N-acetyltransferase [candidate division Zixibacteria bacterium]
MTENDLEAVVLWRNDLEVNQYISNRIKTVDEAVQWFRRVKGNPANLLQGIYEGDDLIGYCIAEGVDLINLKGEIGIIIGKPHCWGTVSAAKCLKVCFGAVSNSSDSTGSPRL